MAYPQPPHGFGTVTGVARRVEPDRKGFVFIRRDDRLSATVFLVHLWQAAALLGPALAVYIARRYGDAGNAFAHVTCAATFRSDQTFAQAGHPGRAGGE
jgi:hypothetical protein